MRRRSNKENNGRIDYKLHKIDSITHRRRRRKRQRRWWRYGRWLHTIRIYMTRLISYCQLQYNTISMCWPSDCVIHSLLVIRRHMTIWQKYLFCSRSFSVRAIHIFISTANSTRAPLSTFLLWNMSVCLSYFQKSIQTHTDCGICICSISWMEHFRDALVPKTFSFHFFFLASTF